MKTIGVVVVSVLSGAVGACIIMRMCKKGKCPCGGKSGNVVTAPASTTPAAGTATTSQGMNELQQEVTTGTTSQIPANGVFGHAGNRWGNSRT